jgi:hypothetical protein
VYFASLEASYPGERPAAQADAAREDDAKFIESGVG